MKTNLEKHTKKFIDKLKQLIKDKDEKIAELKEEQIEWKADKETLLLHIKEQNATIKRTTDAMDSGSNMIHELNKSRYAEVNSRNDALKANTELKDKFMKSIGELQANHEREIQKLKDELKEAREAVNAKAMKDLRQRIHKKTVESEHKDSIITEQLKTIRALRGEPELIEEPQIEMR